MSLILDALRKSERARQRSLSGQVSNVAPTTGHSRFPVPWVTLVGLVLLVNAVVLAFLSWQTERPATGNRETAAPATATPVQSSTAAKPVIRQLAAEVTSTQPTLQPAPARQAPAPQAPAAKTSASESAAGSSSAPLLDTMPQAFQQSLPPLHLDVHGYASKPADRFVVINMQRYVTGETLKEGPRVITITPQGVVLEYRGKRFLLPRT